MARAASLSESLWLPTYGWWPPPERFQASVIVTPYHTTVDPDAKFTAVVRGYAGSKEPLWEHDVGELDYGDERVVTLTEIGVPDPPRPHGGIVELHTIRTDRDPETPSFVGMWIDAVGTDGGGYVIPTQPIRGAGKVLARDDVQVVPGVVVTREIETEVLLLNVIEQSVRVKLVVSSAEGLEIEGDEFEIPPYSPWYESLSVHIPRARRLLASSDGIGSLAVYSNHRLLPHFGYRKDGGPVGSLDHSAPIFAT